ncbi:hypothetical protein M2105_000495 [Paenibacillus sp. PastF-1]|nr:hypothetical protein [Paenibacillus sp. PastF-2]MDF9846080.1 hypothetical protein [Paenibacillus sp. PastM-2]MDF9852653.1 hypothetical protein [Paenibacillus sp. PastF-1]MDH6477616.1 hypothetical protein [Paenibacillus sp. PastH-2]MDH6505359.1 hypothetical protein [Paenibacillus sp. PastM-3]
MLLPILINIIVCKPNFFTIKFLNFNFLNHGSVCFEIKFTLYFNCTVACIIHHHSFTELFNILLW